MKKQTLISLLCAGVLTAGAVTGLMGFANINTATDISTTSDKKVELISSSDIDTAEVSTDGTITGVSDVAAAVMPAVVSITNKSVQEVQNYFSRYDYGGICGSNVVYGFCAAVIAQSKWNANACSKWCHDWIYLFCNNRIGCYLCR